MKDSDFTASLNGLTSRIGSLSAAYSLAVHIPVQVQDVSGTAIQTTTIQYQPVRIVRKVLLIDTTPPAVPTWPNPAFTNVSSTGFTVSWNANTEIDLREYQLWRSVSGGAFSQLAIVPKGTNFYVENALTASTTYAYKLKSVDNSSNASNFSTTQTQTTTATVPQLGWTGALPSPINVPQNSYFDLAPYIVGTPGTLTDSVALPANVTISLTPTPRLVASSSAVVGASTTNNVFTLGTSAEADWIARSTGAGVVWAHDFRYQEEVWAFLDRQITGTQRWQTADGITGNGCLECYIPTGLGNTGSWSRPFSRLKAGTNGLPYDDPGAAGAVVLRSDYSYDHSVDISTPYSSWQGGIYCNNAYNPNYGGHSSLNPNLGANMFDGSDFWIQYRAKIQGSRWDDVQNPDGKFTMITTMRKSNPDQELVIQSQVRWPYDHINNPTTNEFRCYTSNGQHQNSALNSTQGGGGSIEPGGVFASTCQIGDATTAVCWYYPRDTWFTLLFHVIPGHAGNIDLDPAAAGNNGARDTGLQVWTDWNSTTQQRQNTYIKIFDKTDFVWGFGGANNTTNPDDSAEGWSALILNCFVNSGALGAVASTGWYQRYTQVIFSKQTIPCPQI